MTAPARVLLLGIDAANPALLEQLILDGTLPSLGSLLKRSAVARTRGLDGLFIGSTWPSFVTGVNPARHGVHWLTQLQVGTYSYERISGQPEACEPFWMHVSQAGGRVAVLDVPLSRLAPQLNGIQTVEWGVHDRLYGFQTSPDGLREEIVSKFGMHPQHDTCDAHGTSAPEYEAFVGRLVEGALLRGRLTRELLSRAGWDLFVQVFSEAHCAGHQCWHLHDQKHPSYDPHVAAVVGDPLVRVYRAIDTAIGEVLAVAEDSIVLLVVAHGMEHRYGAQFLLPEILFRLGVAVPPPEWAARSGISRAAARRLWRALPRQAQHRLDPLARRFHPTNTHDVLPQLGVQPEGSDCFPVANGLLVGGIRLNLAGREPAGRLEPGSEANRFCEELARDLLAVVNADTGRPMVRRVVRTDDLFRGPLRDSLPDLLVEWNDEGPVANTLLGPMAAASVRATSPKIGVIEGANDWGRTGEHRPGGLLAAAALSVRPGRLADVDLLDIAPTVLRLLGLDLPSLDGKPVPELVSA